MTPTAQARGAQLIAYRQKRRTQIARTLRQHRVVYQQENQTLEEQHKNLRQYLTYAQPPAKPTRSNLKREIKAAQQLLQITTPDHANTWADSIEDLQSEITLLTAALNTLQATPFTTPTQPHHNHATTRE